jgi:hypothetical protein
MARGERHLESLVARGFGRPLPQRRADERELRRSCERLGQHLGEVPCLDGMTFVFGSGPEMEQARAVEPTTRSAGVSASASEESLSSAIASADLGQLEREHPAEPAAAIGRAPGHLLAAGGGEELLGLVAQVQLRSMWHEW